MAFWNKPTYELTCPTQLLVERAAWVKRHWHVHYPSHRVDMVVGISVCPLYVSLSLGVVSVTFFWRKY